MQVRTKVLSLEEELVALRRDFHQYPELGFEEWRTSQRVADYLLACGLEPERRSTTGVVAELRGSMPGPTLLLRADMDALPVQEENDLPYRSANPGKMHACGHDGHTAMLLVAAKVLSGLRAGLCGKIVFVFQPNEENEGALPMIEDGLLCDHPADACMGMHLWPALPTGVVGLWAGPVMAGMFQFSLTIRGKGGHTGYPQQAVDPVLCASNVVQALQMIQTRELDPLEPTILMIGKVQGGTASNIIPDLVVLEGTARYLHKDDANALENVRQRMERIVAAVCQAHRAGYELAILSSHRAVVNDAALAEMVRPAALQVVGDDAKIVRSPATVGEDFSEFSSRVPSVFFLLGSGNESVGACYPHHHPRFNIDEAALKMGVELHVRAALSYLGAPA